METEQTNCTLGNYPPSLEQRAFHGPGLKPDTNQGGEDWSSGGEKKEIETPCTVLQRREGGDRDTLYRLTVIAAYRLWDSDLIEMKVCGPYLTGHSTGRRTLQKEFIHPRDVTLR
ncbi:hypothetical protein RRG08_030142 [Elysia crispata]|uniref:Uncharacterized protein n=1 Tax=Elysia crispata TaxID=231223 RepID=A0AAE1DLC3_9GAST|nr:hypothetical protein RRG08_030142 [Elysia crispata]